MLRATLALFLLSIWTAGAPQSAPQDPRPKFSTRTDLVTVTATVTDARGKRVAGLTRDDFIVTEDGQPQTIEHFSSDEAVPLSMAIVVDTSGSMEDKLEDVEDALEHLVAGVKPDDQVFLLRFSNDVETIGEYAGKDRRRFISALGRLEARGGTALYDGVLAGVRVLQDARHRKRALILVTDGNDTSSRNDERDAIGAVRSAELLVYALGIGHRGGRSFGHADDRIGIETLRRLAEPAGGRAFMLEDAHRGGVDLVDEAVKEVGLELRQQYTLGYYPADPGREGEFRRIRVSVRDSSLTVRAREGYRVPPRTGGA